MALPHIQNSVAGRNKFEPVTPNLFEVKFTLPEPLRAEFGKDELILTEHVQSITGLDGINRAPQTLVQKFMGTDRSYIVPKLDSTRYELEIVLTVNLRNAVDNYIYKLFRAWAALGYDIHTGSRRLKTDYCADWLSVSLGNRAGDIFQTIIFQDVMMSDSMAFLNEYNYETTDAANITVKFVSDWAKEILA